jgi:hypothetical protein
MYCTMLLFYDYKNMNQEVEYKYVMSRNLVFNHALGSKGGGWERKQFGLCISMIYVLIYSRIKRKYANQAKM